MKWINNEINNKKLFLFDIDGTIAFDNTLIDKTLELMDKIRDKGGKYIFITNNSTKSIEDYVDKFRRLGIKVDSTNFLTSSYVTALYLKENFGDDLIFVLGTKSFVKELIGFGLSVTEINQGDIKVAVVGFDNELEYKKIVALCELLYTKDIKYVATNPDLACPTSFGFIPDCGAICHMIEKATYKSPEYIGKPNKRMVEYALKSTGFKPSDTVVIGDRLYTDIACGISAGVDTVLVLTGEAKEKDLVDTNFKPTYYCDSVKDIWECY